MALKIGIYLRISDEDEYGKESDSIKGQREIIHDYLSKNLRLASYEALEFCDDGFSGTDFQRPGVTELLKRAQDGEIACIIVKDFSRFGRNYIEVGSYLEQVFPFLGIRFISVNDNFDSDKFSGNGEFIGIAFQNLIYDLYSRDLSQKISSGKRAKASQGKFINAFAPYGYLKTIEQRLVVDQEAAAVVERIFDMALQGTPKVEIARILNRERVPSPLLLRKMRKEKLNCHCVNEELLWYPATISKILKDQRYAGDGVYGRVKPREVGSKLGRNVPKEDWMIVPNSHEAIVKKEVFDKVNAGFRSYHARENPQVYPLWKKVRCGVCKHGIPRKTYEKANKADETASYCCTASRNSEKFSCYYKKIEEYCIVSAIMTCCNQLSELLYDENLDEQRRQQIEEKIEIDHRLIVQNERKLKQLALAQIKHYEAYRENKINKQDFLEKKAELQKRIKEIEEVLARENDRLGILQRELKDAFDGKKFYLLTSLTRAAVETFVDGIIIEKNGAIRISWNFKDVFQEKAEISDGIYTK
ncbi:recombinase family protein [Anaerotignum sp.]|uniref:recombinase family protein n=1 Tax=Anaerotignum sp. TaxID=2039241 RepID=UPI00289E9E13|nr:recombinase family protein [Anaerotignum sp.]